MALERARVLVPVPVLGQEMARALVPGSVQVPERVLVWVQAMVSVRVPVKEKARGMGQDQGMALGLATEPAKG